MNITEESIVEGVSIYRFHGSYPGIPDLYHTKCERHPNFAGCHTLDEARAAAERHLIKDHG